jgi:hypothetical protein
VTPTGRTPSDPEMQDLRRHVSNPEIIVVAKDMDFADLEMRVLAALADDGVSGIILDLESTDFGCIEIPCSRDMAEIMLKPDMPVKEVREDRPPPSYLQHDFTKNVARYRK